MKLLNLKLLSKQKINLLTCFVIISHLSFIPFTFYATLHDIIISLIFFYILQCIGSSMTYHRLVCHRSWEAPTWFWILGNIIGTLQGKGSALGYSAIHLVHHRESDTDKDPHSPHIKGWLFVQLLPSMETVDVNNFIKYYIKHPKYKLLLWFHRNHWYIHFVYAITLILIYPFGLLSLYLVPAAMSYIAGGLVNNLGHIQGYRNFETKDLSKNNLIAGYLSCGEGWHNNHHADPKNYRFGIKWWEFDPSAILINLIKK